MILITKSNRIQDKNPMYTNDSLSNFDDAENNQPLNLKDLNEDDVISFEVNLENTEVVKVGKFRDEVKKASQQQEVGNLVNGHLYSKDIKIILGEHQREIDRWIKHNEWWFTKGVGCEILQLGSKEWKKGKIKISFSIDFYPDNSTIHKKLQEVDIKQLESPLDEIRKMIADEDMQE